LPRGVSQRDLLASFDAKTGAFAQVPFVDATGAVEPAAAVAPSLAVVDLAGTTVTIGGPVAGLQPMRIGRVLGPDGAPVARIVVTRVLEAGAIADVLDGREKIQRGARVRFDLP
jgi:hypothetical protein